MKSKSRKTKRDPSGESVRNQTGGRWAYVAVAIGAVVVVIFLRTLPQTTTAIKGWPEQVVSGSAHGFNVLLVTLDTTRADRVGCYGYEPAETPVLDSLAAAGIRFDDAVTVAPITLPSHATILTGLNPPNHGARHNGEFHLDEQHETLAEVLQARGYETAAFVSAFVLDARFGVAQGFGLYDDDVSLARSATATAFVKPIYERTADAVTNAATRWLDRREQDRPFFAWVHYFDPHAPYQPPPQLAARFADAPYDGEIAYMDSEIGRLLQTVEKENRPTVIVAVADHGESLGEHGEATHAKLIYDATMRVPLIVSCRELFRAPSVVDDVVVSVADIFPTILDLLGVSPRGPVDGKSLLVAATDSKRTVYMETLAPYLDNGWAPLFGLRRHTDKYILAPKREYYDIATDPNELENLFDQVSGNAKVTRDLLQGELSAVLAAAPSLESVVATAQPLDAEAIRRLESLGYAGAIVTPPTADELPDPKEVMSVLREIDRASGLASAGRFDEALATLKQATALSPRDPHLLLTLGKTYLFMNRIQDAEETFRAVHSLRPSARVCILLAQIMIADGRLEQAGRFLDEAEDLEPTHGGIFLARGDWHAIQARADEAFAAYRHAAEVDPHRAAGEANARIRQLEEAMRRYPSP